jgi:hypothetical protein
VFLRAESKRVAVDTSRRRPAVVLVRLYLVEIRSLTLSETILSVELNLSNFHRVLTFATLTTIENHLCN